MLNTVLTALALGAVSVPALPPKHPPTFLYCQPLAFRDYEVLVGRAAVVRPAPGCTTGSLVRRVSNSGAWADPPEYIPIPTPTQFLTSFWLFISHLEYSLDGETWHWLVLQ